MTFFQEVGRFNALTSFLILADYKKTNSVHKKLTIVLFYHIFTFFHNTAVRFHKIFIILQTERNF